MAELIHTPCGGRWQVFGLVGVARRGRAGSYWPSLPELSGSVLDRGAWAPR
jgi:hypothetical protein